MHVQEQNMCPDARGEEGTAEQRAPGKIEGADDIEGKEPACFRLGIG